MPLPDKFDVIRNDPEWKEFTQNEQGRKRRLWVEQMMGQITSGTPEQLEEHRQRLIENAYWDAPTWQRPIQPTSLYPSAREIPGAMLSTAVRMWAMPQQFYQDIYAATKQPPGRGFWPTAKRAAVDPFIHAFEYGVGEPEAVAKYPYTPWTDPLMLTTVLGIAKGIIRTAPKIAARAAAQVPTFRKVAGRGIEAIRGRIRPPGAQPIAGETAEAFNARVMAEEAARREALKGRISEVAARGEAVGPPKPPTPTPRGPYNRAMPKLTPHYPKEEAQVVAEFVARHPEDVISKEILTKKPLSPSTLSEIERRIFNRPLTAVPPVGPRFRPPVSAAESVGVTGKPINFNDPITLSKWMLEQGGGI